MKKLIYFIITVFILGFLFCSCTAFDITNEEVKVQSINNKIELTYDSTNVSITQYSSKATRATDYELGHFYVRVDSKIPENEGEEQIMKSVQRDYYPQTEWGGTDKNFVAMQRPIYTNILGEYNYLLDVYGLQTIKTFVNGEPTMDDIISSFKGKSVTYHGNVIYDLTNGINELDNYKVIWYVVKKEDSDYHIDGALVPKDVSKAPITTAEKDSIGSESDKSTDSEKELIENTDTADIIIPIDVDYDIVLEVDDFDIRKDGVSDYIAYGNTLEYKNVRISRGNDMKLTISGLESLDWSNNAIWTFEAYLWAKSELISDWAMTDDIEYSYSTGIYNIEVHYFREFQSNETVPYIKLSIHVTHN